MTDAFELAAQELRDASRIQRNTDYAFTVKYGHSQLLCRKIFEPNVRATFRRHGVEFTSVFTYE
jgi:hypothetical protein